MVYEWLRLVAQRTFASNFDSLRSWRAKVIWFIGISGFVLVNAREFWADVLDSNFFQLHQLNYLLPYLLPLLTSIFGFATLEILQKTIKKLAFYERRLLNALDIYQYGAEVTNARELSRLREEKFYDFFVRIDTDDPLVLRTLLEEGEESPEAMLFAKILQARIEVVQLQKKADRLDKFLSWMFYGAILWVFIGPFIVVYLI